MKRFYTIDGDYAEIVLNKEVYPLVSIKKALINFMSDMYIKLNEKNINEYILQIKIKDLNDIEKIIGEFYNELLRESLRYNIAIETKNLRELIVGRALYATCIDIKNEKQESEELYESRNIEIQNYNLDEIAVNWFDKHEDEKE